MRTTLDIDAKLLDQVERLTGEKSRSKAVNRALEEYLLRKAIEGLRSLAGKIDMVDNWRELEELEVAEAAAQPPAGVARIRSRRATRVPK